MHSFDFNELLFKFRYPLLILLTGLILTGFGIFFVRSGINLANTQIEVLDGTTEGQGTSLLTAEIAGAVISPGVYKLSSGARINDLIISGGGLSASADRVWVEKYLNRAAGVTDGQKIYIPYEGEQSKVVSAKVGGGDQTISSNFSSDSNDLININSASLNDLDALPGISRIYGQSIIDHRPYSNNLELVSKGVLGKSVYEKIKDLISTY